MFRRSVYLGVALVATGAFVLPTAPAAAEARQAAESRQNYVVTLKASVGDPGAVASEHARRLGGSVRGVYRYALKGYAASLTPSAAAKVQADSRVASVQPDRIVRIAGPESRWGSWAAFDEPGAQAQDTPTGVRRINADKNANIDIDGVDDKRFDVDIAILDTGIDFDHPDLNVVARTDCLSGTCVDNSGDDGHGHGTHVAGSAAAIDNGIGVVGVAPGARLHAVKVLNDSGSGPFSAIAAGIDWVTARANTIEVANMSLGCDGCTDSATSSALTRATDAGVVFVVAAGNNDKNASTFFPANHADVVTVSALADFNGQPGGGAGSTCRTDQDDTLADFSNWGSAVEITAPGVCINSTFKNGGYNSSYSGTSMASPHVAGAAGLYASALNPNNRTDVLNIRSYLVNNGNLNWTDDSGDGVKEPLLDVGDAAKFPPPTGGNQPPSASFTHSCDNATLACTFDGSGSSDPDGTIASYAWDFGDGTTGTGKTVSHTYGAAGTYTVKLTVTDDKGATGTTTKNVTVGTPPNKAPTASFTFSCSNLACSFDGSGSSDSDGTIASYAWNFGDGTTGTGKTVSHTYGAAGTYTVTLTVTDDKGATGSTSKSVTVSPPAPNQPPVASFTVYSCNAYLHGCVFDGTSSKDPDGSIATWTWRFSDGTTASGAAVWKEFRAAGTYSATLTVTDNQGASSSVTKTFVVP